MSQLIGANAVDAKAAPNRGGLISRLAEPSSDARYQGTFPALIPAGQKFQLEPIHLKLGGDGGTQGVDMQLNTGPIQSWFVNDASVFIVGNSLSNLKTPTMVLMRLDIAISTKADVANGVFTQTIMNIVAAGTAIPQKNGDVKLVTMGSFPVSVNRTGQAITDFELEVTLPNPKATDHMLTVRVDTTPPRITAQYPSACLYTFGQGYDDPVFYYVKGANVFILDANGHPIPTSEPMPAAATDSRPFPQRSPDLDVSASASEEDCAAGAGDGAYPVRDFVNSGIVYQFGVGGINSFLPLQNPSVTFSEPVDPASLAGAIQLAGPSGSVPTDLHTEGSSVVIDPEQPLEYNTAYTLTVGNGVTDLAGNLLVQERRIQFTTAPYVPSTDDSDPKDSNYANIAQTAPFLTVLYPGLPCALDPASGDFHTGGDTAGYCVGSDQSSGAPMRTWSVFKLPANRNIHAVFSKPIKQDSVVLADGCLTAPAAGASVASKGSVAIQRMGSNGKCLGTVAGGILFPHPEASFARSFQFKTAEPWKVDQRYWLVICGTEGTVCPASRQPIMDKDNGDPATKVEALAGFPTHDGRLNTTPMISTGTRYDKITTGSGFETKTVAAGYGLIPAAGGPALIIPFDGAPASRDYFSVMKLLPFTDINGNGLADGAGYLVETFVGLSEGAIGGQLIPEDRGRRQLPNSLNAYIQSVGSVSYAGRGQRRLFQSGGNPVAVHAATENCAVPDAAREMIGGAPGRCVPVTIYPGGLIAQTAANIGKTFYGRTLLHIAGEAAPEDPQRTVPQTGYIVDHCQGSYRVNSMQNYDNSGSAPPEELLEVVGGQSYEYDYSPCFVVSLGAIFSSDTEEERLFAGGSIAPQQGLTVNLVGPVSFARNGRMVIRATNTNDIFLPNLFLPINRQPIFIPSGQVNLQLVGPAIHGGRVFP